MTKGEDLATTQNKGYEETSEWAKSVISASSLLITIPLLELTFLATDSSVPRSVIEIVAIPVLFSSIAFASAILLMIESLERESTFNNLKRMSEGMKGTIPAGAFQALQKSTQLQRWGRWAFALGMIALVVSMLILAFDLTFTSAVTSSTATSVTTA